MTGRQATPTDDVVAEFVRGVMRVDPPQTLEAEIMRSAAATEQLRRTPWLAFGPFVPAVAAVAVTALIIAVGLFITAPRTIGPPPEPTPTPRPTLTAEGARVLTAPGDVIVIPAFDSEGQFGTVRLERGEERASYPDYIPLQAMLDGEVFFVEVLVTYEIDRPSADSFGNIEWGYAVDADGDGLDADDVITQHLGYSVDGEEFTGGPQPLLPFTSTAPDEPISGWIALELPAAGADYDIYLVQITDPEEPPGAQQVPFTAAASALLRTPAEPVGVTTFDFDEQPEGSAPPLPVQRLPTPAPEPMPTFEPVADAGADELLEDPQTCHNDDLAVTIAFPRTWHTNEAYEDLPACTLFDEEPIDAELVYEGLVQDLPAVIMHRADDWMGGATDQPDVPQADFARVPYGDRVGWLLTYEDIPNTQYLVPLGDDPYGPFLRTAAGPETRAVVERMVLLLEFDE